MHHAPRPNAGLPSTAATPGGGARLIGIDALRGAAAVGVCLFHWEHIAFGTATGDQVFRFGLLGVEMFFVISGFVILRVAERTCSIAPFVLARIVRLYPAYIASVILTAAYVLWVGKYDVRVVLVNLTMLQSFFDVPNLTNPYWTLAFEIVFYGLLTAVLQARALDRIEVIGLAWLAAALLYRLFVPGPLGFDSERPLAQLGYILVAPQFAPFFVIGLMVYRLRSGRLGRTGQAAIVAALGLTLFGRGDFADVAGPVYAGFACAMTALTWAASRTGSKARGLAPFAWLGVVSFPLYLVHCTVANLCVTAAALVHRPAPVAVAVSIPLSIVIAAALHHGLERPITSALRQQLGWRSRVAATNGYAIRAAGS